MINRRTFLKEGSNLLIGATAGELMLPVKNIVNKTVGEVTGKRVGNANIYQEVEDACEDKVDKLECFRGYKPSVVQEIMSVVVSPPLEEAIFRGYPSKMVSSMEKSSDLIGDVLYGTGKVGMTRRELFIGVGSSVIFGASHNITNTGIDTQTIPASQTVSGMIYWYLQRKFGIGANTLAHAWINFRL